MSLHYLIPEKKKDTTEEIIHENLIYREQWVFTWTYNYLSTCN